MANIAAGATVSYTANSPRPGLVSWAFIAARSAARVSRSPVASSVAWFPATSGSSRSAAAASSRLAGVTSPLGVKSNSRRPWVRADTVRPRVVVVTPWSALWIEAATPLSISLKASDRPIAAATPVEPPNAAARAPAPATALMPDESSATTRTPAAVIPSAPSPSMAACTSVLILFSE